ncbi:hypothetical protein Ait01nite_017330 [Actinoplanes italicus]|uniref:Uncharacterized protein n=1 Tax=Actinoplanes italicus TaxID=113567 RepID=A0A2T0JZF5_9ACTN|nr:hypothetical protein [Actinoplanes italicus]PRX15890.1 hypothetical protein CLV67_122130 [Actinoplanes italicus]GIE28688.1 hypothetical protein Ait01nite_017330 [Actinoplanes italicus]
MEFYYERKSADYRMTARVGTGRGEYSLAVGLSIAGPAITAHCLNGAGEDCTRTDVPGGSVAMADLVRLGSSPTDWQRSVTVFRPDKTVALLVVIGRRDALPSPAQLTAIGAAPALTLHP